MNRSPFDRERDAGDHTDGGFTLIEVLISVVLLAMIMGALTTALLTSINLSSSTAQHTRDSNDAQLIAGYLVRDAQSAGATNAVTGIADGKYGITLNDDAGCTVPSGDAPIVRFEWLDRPSAAQNYDDIAVYYYLPPASGKSGQVVRKTCGTSPDFASTNTLARNIPAKPAASCDPTPDCPGLPSTVSLTVSEVQNPTQPYTLTASTRPETQGTTPNATGAPAPLVLLGGNACGGAAPLSGTSNVPVTIYGNAFIEGGDSSCAAYNLAGYTTPGSDTEAIAPARCPASAADCTNIDGITTRDPYAGLVAPTPGSAGSSCSGTPDAQTAQPGVFDSGFSLGSGTCTLASGTYYVRNGFTVANGATLVSDDGGVLIYLESGQFNIGGKLIASPLTGKYDGIVLWQAAADPNALTTVSGSNVHLNGIVYAPNAPFTVFKGIAMKGLVAQSLSYGPTNGVGTSQIGLVTPAATSITPNPLEHDSTADQTETVTIDGSNFLDNPPPTVSFSGTGIAVNQVHFVSTKKITVDVTVAANADQSPRDITITNNNQGEDIEEAAFNVVPLPTISSVTLANGATPNVAGTIEAGDTITVVFSKQMSEASLCSTWTGGDAAPQTLTVPDDVTVAVNDGGGTNDDSISITSAAACDGAPVGFGAIDLGSADYITGAPATFSGGTAPLTSPSTIAWSATATTSTMVITLGTQEGGTVAPIAQSTPIYMAPTRLTDSLGGHVTPDSLTLPNGVQF